MSRIPCHVRGGPVSRYATRSLSVSLLRLGRA